jgi:hypothetical protein
MKMAVGVLANWNGIRNLLERNGNYAYHSATIKVTYDQLVDTPQEGALRNCRQADPAIAAQFDRGVEAARSAASIVCLTAELSSCQGMDLSPDERARLRDLIPLLLDAVPATN